MSSRAQIQNCKECPGSSLVATRLLIFQILHECSHSRLEGSLATAVSFTFARGLNFDCLALQALPSLSSNSNTETFMQFDLVATAGSATTDFARSRPHRLWDISGYPDAFPMCFLL
eukprot:TRINITY_DN10545_c2_g1_i1.p1 TRINITY_DN10545_c2_g1~~TRINITY_DN10545_c2_g1_i1.p1  ORF type:complete len:116 (-),score=12.08 TRINITY_DN10545_c2_g1_i1:150-497(-)